MSDDYFEKQRQERIALDNWLQNLKAGDEVAIHHYGSFRGWYSFAKVFRTTTTQIILANADGSEGNRYRRKDARPIGRDYAHECLVIPSQELKDELAAERRRQKLLSDLEKINRDHFTNAQLELIHQTLIAFSEENAYQSFCSAGGTQDRETWRKEVWEKCPFILNLQAK